MSKFYKCDCCGKTEDTKDGFIEFSCKDHSLTITNRCHNAKNSVSFGNWKAIHFCSQKCLNETFFKSETAHLETSTKSVSEQLLK